jgi:hypothetical protein
MPRILVTTGGSRRPADDAVLLDESVVRAHLEDDHAAAQLVERIGWAVNDAADAEERQPGSRRGAAARRRPAPRSRRA